MNIKVEATTSYNFFSSLSLHNSLIIVVSVCNDIIKLFNTKYLLLQFIITIHYYYNLLLLQFIITTYYYKLLKSVHRRSSYLLSEWTGNKGRGRGRLNNSFLRVFLKNFLSLWNVFTFNNYLFHLFCMIFLRISFC